MRLLMIFSIIRSSDMILSIKERIILYVDSLLNGMRLIDVNINIRLSKKIILLIFRLIG